jgi:hypothetical protein
MLMAVRHMVTPSRFEVKSLAYNISISPRFNNDFLFPPQKSCYIAANTLLLWKIMKTILIYLTAWLPMVFIAIANAALREKIFARFLTELRAHQVSSLTAIILFGMYVTALEYLWPLGSASEAWTVGALWLALTLGFEFLAGHYLFGNSWEKLLHDYNILAGRVWILVLLWISAVPYLIFQVLQSLPL